MYIHRKFKRGNLISHRLFVHIALQTTQGTRKLSRILLRERSFLNTKRQLTSKLLQAKSTTELVIGCLTNRKHSPLLYIQVPNQQAPLDEHRTPQAGAAPQEYACPGHTVAMYSCQRALLPHQIVYPKYHQLCYSFYLPQRRCLGYFREKVVLNFLNPFIRKPQKFESRPLCLFCS